MIDVATATDVVGTAWARFADLLTSAGPDVWGRPTRLAGWTVEDLARHVHWGTTLEADGLALAASGGTGPAAGTPLEGPRDEIGPALRRAFAALSERLAQVPEPLAGTVPMPYGALPIAMALDVFVMEAAMHTGDLAHAVDGTGGASLPPGARPSCAVVLQAFWPAFAAAARATPPPGTTVHLVGSTVRVEQGFDGVVWGAAVGKPTVVLQGSDDAVLLYAYGRLPFDEADLTVTGDRELAVRLKEFVPGP